MQDLQVTTDRKQYTDAEVIKSLAVTPLFNGLSANDVAAFAAEVTRLEYSPLQEAVVEGSVPDTIQVVVHGRFIVLLPHDQLQRHGPNAMISLDSFVTGDCFGQSALLESVPAPAAIIASEDSQTYALPRHVFGTILAADERRGRIVYQNLFAMQTRRLRSMAG